MYVFVLVYFQNKAYTILKQNKNMKILYYTYIFFIIEIFVNCTNLAQPGGKQKAPQNILECSKRMFLYPSSKKGIQLIAMTVMSDKK